LPEDTSIGRGAVVGGELVAGREPADVANVAEHGGDDRPDAVEVGQAGPTPPPSGSARAGPVTALLLLVVAVVLAGRLVGHYNFRFLTCHDLTVAGDDLPSNCA
jgi:hypothetical protein